MPEHSLTRSDYHDSAFATQQDHSWDREACLSNSCGCAGVRLLRAAVLAAVARERPGEAEPLALARSHFGCTREAAADLLRSAEVRPARTAVHLCYPEAPCSKSSLL